MASNYLDKPLVLSVYVKMHGVAMLGLNGTKENRCGMSTGRNVGVVGFTQVTFDHYDTLEAMPHRSLMTVQLVRCVKSMVIVKICPQQELRKVNGMMIISESSSISDVNDYTDQNLSDGTPVKF